MVEGEEGREIRSNYIFLAYLKKNENTSWGRLFLCVFTKIFFKHMLLNSIIMYKFCLLIQCA